MEIFKYCKILVTIKKSKRKTILTYYYENKGNKTNKIEIDQNKIEKKYNKWFYKMNYIPKLIENINTILKERN